MLYREIVHQGDGSRLEIALWRGGAGLGYRLEGRRGGTILVRYEHGVRRAHLRTVLGRTAAYAFRSAEQLRYDFERDLEAALQ